MFTHTHPQRHAFRRGVHRRSGVVKLAAGVLDLLIALGSTWVRLGRWAWVKDSGIQGLLNTR